MRPKGAEPPVVSAGQAPRTHRTIRWVRPGTLASVGLTNWMGMWDRDTDVPLRLWGPGVVVSGSVADPAIAETAARQFLAQYLAVLAPGASPADFELVSNMLDASGEIRAVGFIQRANGMRVVGGSIGFEFKRDRLAMISSTALPHVAVAPPARRLAPSVIQRAAIRWLAEGQQTVLVRPRANAAASEPIVIPVVRPRIHGRPSITYRVAEQVEVAATTNPGLWDVWIDAIDGSPIARKTKIMWGSARVVFDVSDRGPFGDRSDAPASFGRFNVDGAVVTSALDGTVTWSGTADASITITMNGQFAQVGNAAGTGNLSVSGTIANGGTARVSSPTNEFEDAQLTAFIHANLVKQFAKTRLNPNLGYLNQVLPVSVNENDTCNAFSTGDDIHFFRNSQQCENTGRLADVVYHEFGHSLHANSIIDGIGAFDGGLSEGLGDSLAMAITGDPGMGRGFFHNSQPLRNLDPQVDLRFPDDTTGEPHDDGEIVGGTMFDLRQALEAKLGAEAGFDQFLKLMYSSFQRASDIPTTYAAALIADDDDGDLSNGTPNRCEIDAAFAKHNLGDPTLALGIALPVRDDLTVTMALTPPAGACPGAATVTGAVIEWKQRGGSGGSVTMTQAGDALTGDIPEQPDGTVTQFKVTVQLSDGSTLSYPDNAADPFYEFYNGEVEVIQCFDFEDGDVSGWQKTPDWEVGAPQGLSTDPPVAFGGNNVFGLDLTQDGAYRSSNQSVAETPSIDLKGHKSVRLQFQRWLGVEDGFYDHAQITANGQAVFDNFASPSDPQAAGVNHIDREWRFSDVDLSAVAATSDTLKLDFILQSDEGLEFGGWTLDDVCIVAPVGIGATCGNATEDDGETCDDGNRVDGDGCSANCQLEDDGGGCCSTGSGPAGALVLSALTGGLVLLGGRRRRRRRA